MTTGTTGGTKGACAAAAAAVDAAEFNTGADNSKVAAAAEFHCNAIDTMSTTTVDTDMNCLDRTNSLDCIEVDFMSFSSSDDSVSNSSDRHHRHPHHRHPHHHHNPQHHHHHYHRRHKSQEDWNPYDKRDDIVRIEEDDTNSGSSSSKETNGNSVDNSKCSFHIDTQHNEQEEDSNNNNNNNAAVKDNSLVMMEPLITSPCMTAKKCVQTCAEEERVCPAHGRIVAKFATTALRNLTQNSHLYNAGDTNTGDANDNSSSHSNHSTADGPTFRFLNPSDLCIGNKLGEGGFSEVYSCTLKTKNNKNDNAEPGQATTTQEYAVKLLKRTAMVSLHNFKHGAADIAMEAYFLQALRHKHIVQVHGVVMPGADTDSADNKKHSLLSVTAGIEQCALAAAYSDTTDPTNHSHVKDAGFGLLIDRLHDTLKHRIQVWRNERKDQTKQLQFLQRFVVHAEQKQKQRADVLSRCAIALQIADALQYLHSKRIIYRDLKPDNIGFDGADVLKLFDFGLAKELKAADFLKCGRYELTGNTGSRRYMAPEVAKAQPYNESVDVYSFGILFWEVLTTKTPFYGNPRKVLTYWPAVISWLVQRCWSNTPAQRPSFAVIRMILVDVLKGHDKVPNEKEFALMMKGEPLKQPASSTPNDRQTSKTSNNNNNNNKQVPQPFQNLGLLSTFRSPTLKPQVIRSKYL